MNDKSKKIKQYFAENIFTEDKVKESLNRIREHEKKHEPFKIDLITNIRSSEEQERLREKQYLMKSMHNRIRITKEDINSIIDPNTTYTV